MTDEHPIGIRLRFEDAYIVVYPPATPEDYYTVTVTDALGNAVPDPDRIRALGHLLRELSDIRQLVYASIGGRTVPPRKQ